jgi:uncharacterized membrane protein YcaP (DUF421 family)
MHDYLPIIYRSVLSFLILFTLARILGKKQISHLTFFDYVVGIVIGDMASTIAIDKTIEISHGIIGLLIYTIFSILMAYGAIKSFKFRDLVESSPAILVKDGKIMEKTLKKHKMTFDDLLNGLREKGAFKLEEVEMAILETNGQISVLKKSQYQPVTPNDMRLSVQEDHAPSLAVIDGIVLEKHLQYLGYSKEWLLAELQKQGAKSFEEVFVAQIDSQANVYVDLYEDDISVSKQPDQKEKLGVQLRNVQAELEKMAIQTKDQNAKKMYFKQSKEIQRVINKVNPHVN